MKRRCSFLILGGCALIVATGGVRGQGVKSADSPATVAHLLDKLVQPRFLRDAGKFGTDRLIIAGHEDQPGKGFVAVYSLEAKTKTEKGLLRAANAVGRDYAIGFLHCPHKRGKFLPKSPTNGGSVGGSIGSGSDVETLVVRENNHTWYSMPDGVDTEEWDNKNLGAVRRAVKNILPKLKQGQPVDVQTRRLFFAFRPVKASQSSCVGCHSGAKKGDVLGIMAYAVSMTTHR